MFHDGFDSDFLFCLCKCQVASCGKFQSSSIQIYTLLLIYPIFRTTFAVPNLMMSDRTKGVFFHRFCERFPLLATLSRFIKSCNALAACAMVGKTTRVMLCLCEVIAGRNSAAFYILRREIKNPASMRWSLENMNSLCCDVCSSEHANCVL